MQRILSRELPLRVGERVTIAGWVHRRRLLKSVAFLIVRDRAGLAQVVVAEPATRELLCKLTEETIVEVEAEVVANAAAPAGVELTDPVVRAPDGAAVPPPFDLYRPQLTATLPTMLDHAAVALRHGPRQQAFRMSAAAVAGFRAALDSEGFVEVHTPKVVASATESGANVFALDWFGRPAYLAQSPQFYKQTLVGVFERVYEVGPVFRAEPHDTVRHLAQYTSLDVELGFISDHRDVMRVLRDVLAAMTASVAQREAAAVAALGLTLPDVPAEIPQVHFADALALVGAALGEDLSAEPDLAPAHERWLGEWARREHGSDFLFVTGYPMAKRPFYTHPDPARPAYSNGFDLLFRGIELVTGGQRLHRYEDYVAALAAAGEPIGPYESYVEVFRHGMPRHGGFAIGLERFMMRLLEATNVREVTLFPRDLHRLTP
ncbi:aspartate--tRNA(Asn) ligase [Luedemannella flava]|uniref:Aspartate--tRNA(Asp/Asn) ligase n=1 Tax=Luedemannella flava TaxID=349316 RepID=A0ABP4YDQ0_9ACTN